MLSVLIPTYNYNAYSLVKELHNQLINIKISFEIICLDDGSKSGLNIENKKINELSYCSFQILDKNIGRSAIRNLLASKAKFKWLLFLDADVMPINGKFISKYISNINKEDNVFCGGIKYKKTNTNSLRYKYGVKYEQVYIEDRKKRPHKYFFTSNFLIPKKVFKYIQFEEKLKKYGREDYLFSLNLQKKGYKILQLENEVYHLGIDDDPTFVVKTKEAMENIIFLEKESLLDAEQGSILRLVNKIKSLKLQKTIGKLHPLFERKTIKRKSIFYFNLLKVSYLCYLKTTHK